MKISNKQIYPLYLKKNQQTISNTNSIKTFSLSGANNNVSQFYINFKNKADLSLEIKKAFVSKDLELKKEYFKNILINHSFLLRNCSNSEYIKVLQTMLDNIKFEKFADFELFSDQIEFLSKMALPNVGLENEINIDNFVKNSENFICDNDYILNKINRILLNLGCKNKVKLDITSHSEYPINLLSNFAETDFIFDGIKIKSMEGFLQSLKTNSTEAQEYICQLNGLQAKGMGKKLNKQRNYDFQNLYWRGKLINRNSEEYQNLLKKVYFARYQQDDNFRFALEYTKNYTLTHELGGTNPKRTLLTQEEFINNLNVLR